MDKLSEFAAEAAAPALAFHEMIARHSKAQVRQLAQIKRFMERLCGDDQFRATLEQNERAPRALAEEYGIDLDPALIRPLFEEKYRNEEALRDFPLAALWVRHTGSLLKLRAYLRKKGGTAELSPAFHRWRERQIKRTDGECGASAEGIVHPIVAFELCDGCSVGCWFCGISADKFRGAFAYTAQNAELWRGVVEVIHRRFGQAAQTGFCYWGTDPFDNPDYPRFLEDYYRITGFLPQTTTALPLKDIELTREVLALFERFGTVVNRFSILSRKALDQVHTAFSADELLGVELIMQNKESVLRMSGAGRARENRERMVSRGFDASLLIAQGDQNTIACVSGFLVNMVKGTLRLISPTRPTEKWPDGYKVLGTERFTDVGSFEAGIERLVEDKAESQVSARRPLRFRSDLRFTAIEDGFEVASSSVRHRFNRLPFHRELGELISLGKETPKTVVLRLVGSGACIFAVQRSVSSLYQHGLLQEADELEGEVPTSLPVLQ